MWAIAKNIEGNAWSIFDGLEVFYVKIFYFLEIRGLLYKPIF